MGTRRLVALAGAAVGWFALVLQLALIVTVDSPISVGGRIVNFFSFFTILSNILVASVLSAAALDLRTGRLALLFRPRIMAAAALYIGLTGIIYFLILRTIWDPQGWQLVADSVLHYAMPVVYLAFWIAFAPRGHPRPADIPALLVFPVIYAAYSLVRGPLVHWYPYPFLDLDRNGIGQVTVNVVFLLVGLSLLAAMLIALDRILASRRLTVTATDRPERERW